MPDRALETTKNFDKNIIFLFSMLPQLFSFALDRMVTHSTP